MVNFLQDICERDKLLMHWVMVPLEGSFYTSTIRCVRKSAYDALPCKESIPTLALTLSLLFIAFSCLLCQWWPFSSCFWINKLNLDMKIFWSVITACVWLAIWTLYFQYLYVFYIHDSSGAMIHFRLRFMYFIGCSQHYFDIQCY